MSDLVIGEGVALDLRLAKLPSRALARMLDLLIQGGATLLLSMVFAAVLANVDQAVASALVIILAVAVVVGYPTLMETVTGGRTVGKIALGLRVVRVDGGPIRFRHALTRELFGIFDFYLTSGVLAAVTSFCSKDGRRTGDLLAGTTVIRDKTPDSGMTPAGLAALAMPYPLLGWAQGLELSALPDEAALAARQYLTRMYELRPDVSARMGYDLMVEVSQYISLPPPRETPPWAYLAAVTAERRARQMRKAEAEWRTNWERHNEAQATQARADWDRQNQNQRPRTMPYTQQQAQQVQVPATPRAVPVPEARPVPEVWPVHDAKQQQAPATQAPRPARAQLEQDSADSGFRPPN